MRRLLVGAFPRLLVVGLTAMALQRVLFARHPVFDVRLQLPLALVVAAGVGGGSDKGAVAGLALGLMYDLSGNTPVGMTALCYVAGGIVAGYPYSFTPDPQWWLAMMFAFVGAAVGELAVPFMEVVTGDATWLGGDLFTIIPVVALGAALVCPLLLPLARWMTGVKPKKWKAPVG